MTDKATGITKAAITGAFVGGAFGMIAAPKEKKKRKQSIMSDVSGTLRIVGVAMQDISSLLRKR